MMSGEPQSSFKTGSSVRIKEGIFRGHLGEVIETLTMPSSPGLCILVWVKLNAGRVDGFSPDNLERLRSFPRRQAA